MSSSSTRARLLVLMLPVLALLTSPVHVNLASAGALTADQRLRLYQKPLLDAEAPAGTDVTSAHGSMHDAPITVRSTRRDSASVLETQSAETGGKWSLLPALPKGFNAYHMIMGPSGKILLIAGSGNNKEVFAAGTFKAYIWSPTKGIVKTVKTPTDMFCSGHMLMSNGKGIAAGGTSGYAPWKGSKGLYTFDFAKETFTRQANMSMGRWYPSIIDTPGGYALITGGLDSSGMNSGTSEVFTPSTAAQTVVTGTQAFPLYPQIFLTADRRYFFTGEGWANTAADTVVHAPGFWEPFDQNAFTPVTGLTNATQRGSGASCFVGDVRDQDLMVMGGGWPATASTDIIKLDAADPAYAPGPDLPAAKAYVSCLGLPDGTLLEANGGSANAIAAASHEVSVLTSADATAWTPMNPMPAAEHRLYHSMLFLADNGDVISMGSNPKGETRSNTVLRYQPPYQFRGTKPTLSTAPAKITYGRTYTLGMSSDVTSVVVDASPSPTHSSDLNARTVTLPVVDGTITTSFSSTQFPRGYVRLWARNDAGAISVASWTKLS